MEKALHRVGASERAVAVAVVPSSLIPAFLVLSAALIATVYRILRSCGQLPPLEDQAMMGGDDLPEVLGRCAVLGAVVTAAPPPALLVGGPSSPLYHAAGDRASVGAMEGSAGGATPPSPPQTVMAPLAESAVLLREDGDEGPRAAPCEVSEALRTVGRRIPFLLLWLHVYRFLRMDYSFVVQGKRTAAPIRRPADMNASLALWYVTERQRRRQQRLRLHGFEPNEPDEPSEAVARPWEHMECGVPLSFHSHGEAPLMFDAESGEAVPVALRDDANERYDAHLNILQDAR